MTKTACSAFLLWMGVLAGVLSADENEWFVPLGRPPEAPPKRISGGESFPPLPLPATPLRRSENKRQPSSLKLIGKVVWGESGSYTYGNGQSARIADWNLCPADLQGLLRKVSAQLGLNYGGDEIMLSTFDGDPGKLPVLLISGTRTVKLDEKQLVALRSYVLRGGMVVFDSVAGSPYFYNSATALMRAAFPESAVRVIPLDHPIYHIVNDATKVHYSRNLNADVPYLEGIYVGSRIGVLFSKFGLGCGWDDHEVPFLSKAVYYDVPSAGKLGVNLAAYAVGYARIGREESKPEAFSSLDEKQPTDEMVFAQIQHGGAWNAHPNNASILLRRLRQSTSLRVNLKRVGVDPAKDDLSPFTFLFLTGLDDFQFDGAAIVALRRFLNNNGAIFINNGLGLHAFDKAVRRELSRILPDARLEVVPLNHAIYRSVFPIAEVQYSPAVMAEKGAPKTACLEGITIRNDLRVIYSPYDIEAGWIGLDYPMAKTLLPDSATQLGMNIFAYAFTH
ncbi:MAG: DUF4159 domain-containing protein [Verrucomicrobia bacterium]|nr:DUF4159 domain-containing protein [Verrucomicrobiota bacterium]